MEEIKKTADESGLAIFAVERDIKGLREEKIKVYGNDFVKKVLDDKSKVQEGLFNSFSLGKIELVFKDFDSYDYPDKLLDFYLIGDMDDARDFKSTLIDKYGGESPKEGYSYYNPSKVLAIVRLVSIAFLLILSILFTELFKKEVLLKFIYGEDIRSEIFSYIIRESLIFSLIYLAIFFLLRFLFTTKTDYMLSFSMAMLALFIVLNGLIYYRLVFLDFKRSINNAKTDKKILRGSYIFQIALSFMVISFISINIDMVSKSHAYISQRDFFKEMSDYYYINSSLIDKNKEANNETIVLQENYIGSFLKKFRNKRFTNVYLQDGMRTGKAIILSANNAKSFILSNTDLDKGRIKEDAINLLIPQNYVKDGLADLEMLSDLYFPNEEKYNTLTYSKIETIAISKNTSIQSKIYKDPLIFLDLRSEQNYFNPMYISELSMYKMNDNTWKELLANKDIDYLISYRTNVYEFYLTSLSRHVRYLILSLVFLLIFLILYYMMVRIVIGLHIKFKSKEIMVKTILGYGFFKKYFKIYRNNLIPRILG
ncbi:hypothetical protein, partial [uncultured Anaerococcus sp.]|uniref:hypothetical protein n=1 Tax=uncultured Anaerococcus sp. TaxID=293428 RepID=UPI0026278019